MRRMETFFTLLILSGFLATSLGDVCYDASGEEVENGRLECELSLRGQYDRYKSFKYACQVTCKPGYISRVNDFHCLSNPFRPKRGETVDMKKEFQGQWNSPRHLLNCTLPTYCPSMAHLHPKNGKSNCLRKNGVDTCSTSCDFPYIPSEPEFTQEYCSNETQFFWTHVLRNNKSEFPPCQVKENCDDIETTVIRNNGRFKCNDRGIVSKSCKLQCNYGYILTTGNTAAFCGSPTGFRWSNEWAKYKPEVGELAQCEKAPITVEFNLLMKCSDSRDVLNLVGAYLENESPINSKESFPMWKKQSYQVECDKSIQGDQMVKFYFNFKDECTFGTCSEACFYLDLGSTNLQQCKEVCALPMANSLEMLNKQRNFILSYIAKIKGDEKKLKSHLSGNQYELQSMNVIVEKSNYTGDVKGPNSPFCGVDV